MKKRLALLLALILVLSVLASCSAPDAKGYRVQAFPVLWKERDAGSFELRFYDAAPHVPYCGMKAYLDYMRGEEVTLTAGVGSVWEVTDPLGNMIEVDPAAGTITAADWAGFRDPMIRYKTPPHVFDTNISWIGFTATVYEDEPAPVVFDFAKYGIPIYYEGKEIYMPLGLMTTMFNGGESRHMVFNGESITLPWFDAENGTTLPLSFYDSRRMQDLLNGRTKREEDEIREDYAELCFIIDYFFGYPGASALDPVIRERGLDETLKARAGDIRTALLSDDYIDFMIGLYKLTGMRLDDGHTGYIGIKGILDDEGAFPAVSLRFSQKAARMNPPKGEAIEEIHNSIRETRAAVWGDETYRECGSTAIIRLDSFLADKDAWNDFYAGKGDLPGDALGVTVSGLKKASENPAVRNVLFDISANGGGDVVSMMAVLDLAAGINRFRGYDVLTRQRFYSDVRTDKDLDKALTDGDDEIRYGFNYAVLTSRASFSAANMFPVMMQEHGAVLIGEPSGGGSCAVMFGVLSGGAEFLISGNSLAFRTLDGGSVEDGCRTDIPIARIEPEKATHPNARLSDGDYSPFFDDEALDRMINEWFDAQEEAPAA